MHHPVAMGNLASDMRLHKESNLAYVQVRRSMGKRDLLTCKMSQDDGTWHAMLSLVLLCSPFQHASKTFRRKDDSSYALSLQILTPYLPSNQHVLKVVPCFQQGRSVNKINCSAGPSIAFFLYSVFHGKSDAYCSQMMKL